MAEPIRLAAANEAEPQRLPRNIEAEAAFLGAILIDNRIIEDVSIKLQPDHFFEPLHGRVYEQILRLIDRNMLVTPVTLKPFFEADEAMRELSSRYGHFRFAKTGILDAFFEAYGREGVPKGQPFLDWVANTYDPEKLEREFKPHAFSSLIADRLFRRE